jgi:hypothetical protein
MLICNMISFRLEMSAFAKRASIASARKNLFPSVAETPATAQRRSQRMAGKQAACQKLSRIRPRPLRRHQDPQDVDWDPGELVKRPRAAPAPKSQLSAVPESPRLLTPPVPVTVAVPSPREVAAVHANGHCAQRCGSNSRARGLLTPSTSSSSRRGNPSSWGTCRWCNGAGSISNAWWAGSREQEQSDRKLRRGCMLVAWCVTGAVVGHPRPVGDGLTIVLAGADGGCTDLVYRRRAWCRAGSACWFSSHWRLHERRARRPARARPRVNAAVPSREQPVHAATCLLLSSLPTTLDVLIFCEQKEKKEGTGIINR